jgi:hypothetical protein
LPSANCNRRLARTVVWRETVVAWRETVVAWRRNGGLHFTRSRIGEPRPLISKQQICEHVWGQDRPDNVIEKLVSRLRHKVDQEEPQLIHTRRGFGCWLG